MTDETTPTSDDAPASRRRLTPWAIFGIVGAVVVGSAFAGGLTLGLVAQTGPTATSADARPLPAETAEPTAVRTCSVSKLLDDKALGTETVVVTTGDGATLLEVNASDPIPMGSVMKVITAAVALDVLGPKGRLTTMVVDGSSEGSVILVGGGDPTLRAGGSSVYPGAPSIEKLANDTVAAYQQKHPDHPTIDTVHVDLSMFPVDDAWNDHWPESERTVGYQPMIVPLMVDGDRANPALQTSPRSSDPAQNAAEAFVRALQMAGNGDGDVTIDYAAAPSNAKELASVSSEPVATLIKQMIPNSDNTLAEFLMRASSVAKGFDGGMDSIQQLVIGSIGTYDVDLSAGSFEDGSGESNKDLIPPRAMAELIDVVFSDSDLAILKDSLPIAGQSGTLASRFVGQAESARGHVQAKTGWIDGVYALAGQVDGKNGALNAVVVARGKVSSSAMAAIDNLVAGIYSCGDNLASF